MRPRPRVDLQVPLPPEEVLSRFRARLEGPGCPCEGTVGTRELSLVLAGGARHLFSPWISLEVWPREGGASLRGRFGPHPNLWGLFVLLYAALVFTLLAATTFGFVQWTLQETATGWAVAVGALVALGLACGIDLGGRWAGSAQMATLHAFLHEVLPEAAEG